MLQTTRAPTRRWRTTAAAAVLALALAIAAPMVQPAKAGESIPTGAISLEVDKAGTIALSQPATTVFVANPAIADVQADDPRRVVIFGRKPGATTVYITTRDGEVQGYTVNVEHPYGQLIDALKAQDPDATLNVTSGPGGLTVTGQVATPRQAAALKALATQFVGDKEALNFNVGVTGGTQVNLQVRIVEVSRRATQTFGFNWQAVTNNGSVAVGLLTGRPPVGVGGLGDFVRDNSLSQLSSLGAGYHSPGGSADITALVDALQTEGLVSILAEPNLTATSGESASFLAGGEFPVPVSAENDKVTIEWKRFGVSLDFTPTVLDDGRMSIKVRPEVSELSDQGAVMVNNIKIPGIAVRRADTTVELASGQSFAIAGLFKNNAANSVKQFPGLGELPVLGALFRSSEYKRDQSELVIIVTPYIVQPAARPADLRLPTDGIVMTNPLEQALTGKVAAGPDGKHPHLSGPGGFMLEEDH